MLKLDDKNNCILNICNNNQNCNFDNTSNVICSCQGDYFGNKCERTGLTDNIKSVCLYSIKGKKT